MGLERPLHASRAAILRHLEAAPSPNQSMWLNGLTGFGFPLGHGSSLIEPAQLANDDLIGSRRKSNLIGGPILYKTSEG